MRIKLSALLLAGLLLVSLLPAAARAADRDVLSDARNGVVRVLAFRNDGTSWTGSAFGVGEAGEPTSVFVTNHHVSAGNDFASAADKMTLSVSFHLSGFIYTRVLSRFIS